MAARDHWTLHLACPNCGNIGSADVSEGDYPFLQDPDFSVEKLHGTFSVRRLGQTALETSFRCDQCGKLLD
jgi:predicted RNA-binding Zn-ribbon protein involved in translation (DUF1610 family)